MKYNSEERIGVHSVAKIFTQQLKWIFREQPVNDFGIDAFVEITTIGLDLNTLAPTGRLIGVQIKSGKSYFKESQNDHIIFRGSKRHLEYWLNHSIPVIMVIYDQFSDRAYWQEVDKTTAILTDKSFKLKIPKKNVLKNTDRNTLSNIALFKNSYQYKLWQLQSSLEQIMLLLKRKQLYLYIEIDGVPRSDEYHITLVATDEDCDSYPEVFYNWDFGDPNRFEYNFFMIIGQSLKEALNDTIPWADLFIDGREFTDEILTTEIVNNILSFGQEEFVQDVVELSAKGSFLELACYLTDSYCFKLELKANELTHAFLLADSFLSKEPIVRNRLYL